MIGNTVLLARKSLALLLSTILATQPLLVQAAELTADPNAGQQPDITTGNNGVPLVNIVTPNAAGLSHNKYSDFNVDERGLILNNSVGGSSQSPLGGLVHENSKLQDSGPAQVILNEVTGTGRSLLEGTIEVHGTAANVVIANPNGLTCNGCGFVNTPHVTLSTGTPEFGDDLALKALTVKGGDVTIGAKGANLGSVDVFDIVSRKISVGGPVSGRGDLNLIAGANRYYYGTGEVEALPGDGLEPEVAIDSSALGGMYAGRIKVISNDKGSGVNMQGQMAANAGALSITADGKLTLHNAKVKGDLSARSKSSTVRLEHTIFSEKAVVLEGLTSVELAENAALYALGDVKLAGKAVTLGKGATAGAGVNNKGVLSKNGSLTVTGDIVKAGDAKLAGGKLLSITAGEVHIASEKIKQNGPTLRSYGDIEIKANTVYAVNSVSKAAGNINISSEQQLRLNLGHYHAGNLVSVKAASLETDAWPVGKKGVVMQTTKSGLHNMGKISSQADVLLTSAAGLANSGQILASNKVDLKAAVHITNNANATISGKQTVQAAADRIINKGQIGSSQGAVKLQGQSDFSNLGKVQAKTIVDLQSAATFGNSGNILSEGTTKIVVTNGDLKNRGGVRAGTIDLKSKTLENRGKFTASELFLANIDGHVNNSSIITAKDLLLHLGGRLGNTGRLLGSNKIEIDGKDGVSSGEIANGRTAVINGGNRLYIAAGLIRNAGSMGAGSGSLEFRTAGNIFNRGLFYSKEDSLYLVSGDLTNNGGYIISEQEMNIKGLLGPRLLNLLNVAGTIEAVHGNMSIAAENIYNKRSPFVVTETSEAKTESVPSSSNELRLTGKADDGLLFYALTKPAKTITTITTRERGRMSGSAGKYLAGGNLVIETGTLTNSYSQIAAGGAMSVQAETVVNEGRDLLQTVDATTVVHHFGRHCRPQVSGPCLSKGTHSWDEMEYDGEITTLDSIYGTIQAGAELSIKATGYVHNYAVRGNNGGLNLDSGGKSMAEVSAPGPIVLPKMIEATARNVSIQGILGRPAIFQPIASLDAPHLIKTRSEFIDPSQYIGSDYFLDRVTAKPDASVKRFGDGYVDFTLLRDQMFDLTGKMSPSTPQEHNELLKTNYHNALKALGSMGLKVGEPLTELQVGKLTSNIVWLEKKQVLGREVLVPRLYIAPVNFKTSDISGAQIKAGEVKVEAGQINNFGTVRSDAGLAFKSQNNIVNLGGRLAADGNVTLEAKRTAANLSGSVSGDNLSIKAGNVINSTLKTRYYYPNGLVDQDHAKTEPGADGDLAVTADTSIVSVFETSKADQN